MQKAHPNIQNILLQLLDEGRLTDGQGKTVDFTNTIIIFTSNLGAADLVRGMDPKTGTIPPIVKDRVMNALKDHFKPEFIIRLDSSSSSTHSPHPSCPPSSRSSSSSWQTGWLARRGTSH